MSRWKVARHEVTSWLGTSYQWCVMDAENFQIRDFATHAEALDYADRMARTREVVLTRKTGVITAGGMRFGPWSATGLDTGIPSVVLEIDNHWTNETVHLTTTQAEELGTALLSRAARIGAKR